MSLDEVKQKFRGCASYSAKPMPRENVEMFLEAAMGLEKLSDISTLIDPLTL